MKKRMLKHEYKPERDYDISNDISMEYLEEAFKSNLTITGRVIDYDVIEKYIIVDLGNGFSGVLPFEEVCIEKLKYFDDIPIQVSTISLKSAIRIKITKISNNIIYLSRKKNLLEVYEYYEKENENEKVKVTAIVEKTCSFGVFCDVGDGLISLCYYTEMSKARMNPKSFLEAGTRVKVKIYKYDSEKKQLSCSMKKAEPMRYSNIIPNTWIYVKIGDPLIDSLGYITGYFVQITPSISGIADVQTPVKSSEALKNGETVEAYVRAVFPHKHKVKLILK